MSAISSRRSSSFCIALSGATRGTILLLTLVSSLASIASAADVDGDGMEDAWESSNGLNPANAADAFADKDGDRIPNLWEYVRGTEPDLATSIPSFDAIVDYSQSPSGNRYQTLQAAYDSLSSGVSGYRFLVHVKRGTYAADLDAVTVPKQVAWIGEKSKTNDSGAADATWSTQRARGHEGVILDGVLGGGAGLQFGDETLLDGIIVANWRGYPDQELLEQDYYPATTISGVGLPQQIQANQKPAISILPAVPADKPEVRLVNCIIRNWRPTSISSLPEPAIPGAVLNKGGALSLVHTSITGCVSSSAAFVGTSTWGGETYYNYNFTYQGSVQNAFWLDENDDEIYGDLAFINTAVWDVLGEHNVSGVLGGLTGVAFTTSAVHGVSAAGNLIGPSSPHPEAGYFPNITNAGYQSRYERDTAAGDSIYVLRNKGTSVGVLWDINGEARTTTAGTIDIGADEWVNTTGTGETAVDDLPDWWEFIWFGSRSATNAGNTDGDAYPSGHYLYPSQDINNLSEFFDGARPTVDQDGDGLTDEWELGYWVHLGVSGSAGTDDPDDDTYTNADEEWNGTDPLAKTSLYDWDSDGLPDAWEFNYFGHMNHGANDNLESPQPDGRTNIQEFIAGTDPTELDADWDSDGDGLMDVWEIAHFTSIGAQNENGNPDNDWAINLHEQALGTNPNVADVLYPDTDLDGWYDYTEENWFGVGNLDEEPEGDFDEDGLANRFEVDVYGTSPISDDSNDDGISDYWAYWLGWSSSETDHDGDGLSSDAEVAQGLNPFAVDSDGDGKSDDVDPMPLDPSVWLSGQVTNALGAPVITLLSPLGAQEVP